MSAASFKKLKAQFRRVAKDPKVSCFRVVASVTPANANEFVANGFERVGLLWLPKLDTTGFRMHEVFVSNHGPCRRFRNHFLRLANEAGGDLPAAVCDALAAKYHGGQVGITQPLEWWLTLLAWQPPSATHVLPIGRTKETSDWWMVFGSFFQASVAAIERCGLDTKNPALGRTATIDPNATVSQRPPTGDEAVSNGATPDHSRPQWDEITGTLSMDGDTIARVSRQAKNQRAILTKFQEENWKPTVNNPLPSPQQAQDAIYGLNRKTKQTLTFHGAGDGHWLKWSKRRGTNQATTRRTR